MLEQDPAVEPEPCTKAEAAGVVGGVHRRSARVCGKARS